MSHACWPYFSVVCVCIANDGSRFVKTITYYILPVLLESFCVASNKWWLLSAQTSMNAMHKL